MKLEQPIAIYSGSPQVEDGYTKIANELLDEIILFKFSLRQIKVIFSIIRKTYGFNKKEDDISLSQIGAMCQLPSSHVSKEIKSLVEMNVIRKRAGRYGHILSLNKNYDEWIYLESSGKSDKVVSNDNDKNYHYIYKITNLVTNEFYIGVRSCLCLPAQDRYIGSGNWIASQNKRQLDKVIIEKYDTRELAEIAEAEQIRMHIDNPLNRNKRMYLSTSKQLHNMSPITESVTLQNRYLSITESVTEPLQNPSPQKTTPKDNTKDISNKSKKRTPITLKKYIEDCKNNGVRALPEDCIVFKNAETLGIENLWIASCWYEFKQRYFENDKKQADWIKTFNNCIKGNWFRAWSFNKDGSIFLTSEGHSLVVLFEESLKNG